MFRQLINNIVISWFQKTECSIILSWLIRPSTSLLSCNKSSHFYSHMKYLIYTLYRCCQHIRHCFGQILPLSSDSCLGQFCATICTDGTFYNYAAKSVLGYFGMSNNWIPLFVACFTDSTIQYKVASDIKQLLII